jgi:Zn-dependent protease with chaperone function
MCRTRGGDFYPGGVMADQAKKLSLRAQFEARVQQAETIAREQPVRYRRGVIAWAALGYAAVFVLLAVLLSVFGVMLWSFTVSAAIIIFLVKSKLIFLVGGAAWVTTRALWVSFDAVLGCRPERKETPALFAEIDSLCKELGVKLPDEIVIDQSFNAAMIQTPRLGIFGWHKTTLLLGVQLLLALTPDEARGVIAHELAHFSRKHSAFAAKIYRARIAWQRIASAVENKATWGGAVFRKPIEWYISRFDAYTFPLARSNEFEADRLASQCAHGAIGAALIRVNVGGDYASQHYWKPLLEKPRLEAGVPVAPFHGLAQFLGRAEASRDAKHASLEKALGAKTQFWDTHPSLNDRLRALGVTPSVDALSPLAQAASAAPAWVQPILEDMLSKFDAQWEKDNRETLDANIAIREKNRERWDALERADAAAHTREEAFEWAALTEQFQGEPAALVAYQTLAQQYPESKPATYHSGRLQLAQGNVTGALAYLEPLRKTLPYSPSVCAMLAEHYRTTGDGSEAECWQLRAEQQQEKLNVVIERRGTIAVGDSVAPAVISDDIKRTLAEKLESLPQVKWASLVEKSDPELPDDPLYALAIGVSRDFNAETLSHAIVAEIADTLSISWLFFSKGETEDLAKYVRKQGLEIVAQRA